MTAQSKPFRNVDELAAEVDFSGGVRGKFYRADANLNLPIYLEGVDIQTTGNATCGT